MAMPNRPILGEKLNVADRAHVSPQISHQKTDAAAALRSHSANVYCTFVYGVPCPSDTTASARVAAFTPHGQPHRWHGAHIFR